MKKFFAISLALLLVFSFVACGDDNNTIEATPTPTVEAQNQNGAGEATPTPTVSGGEEEPTATPTVTPTATPEPTCQHVWSGWAKETKAYVTKAGTEKRICTKCQGTETRERTVNAVYNSFYNFGYQYLFNGTGELTTMGVIDFAAAEFGEYGYKSTPVSTIIAELKKHFNIDSQFEAKLKNDIKSYNYDAAKDEITLEARAESGDLGLRGYKHLGGNKYATYYTFSGFDIFEDLNELYEVEVELNRDNGQTNKFVSFKRIQELPDDMIGAAPDEQVER